MEQEFIFKVYLMKEYEITLFADDLEAAFSELFGMEISEIEDEAILADEYVSEAEAISIEDVQ